jgi:hypothetical protein
MSIARASVMQRFYSIGNLTGGTGQVAKLLERR